MGNSMMVKKLNYIRVIILIFPLIVLGISVLAGTIVTDQLPEGNPKGYVDLLGLHLRRINQAFVQGSGVTVPRYNAVNNQQVYGSPQGAYQGALMNSATDLASGISQAISMAIQFSKSRVEIFDVSGSTPISLGFFLYSASGEDWNMHRIALSPGDYDLALCWAHDKQEILRFHVKVELDTATPVYINVENRIDFLDIRAKILDRKIRSSLGKETTPLFKEMLFNDIVYAERAEGLHYFKMHPKEVDEEILNRLAWMSVFEKDSVMIVLAEKSYKAGLSQATSVARAAAEAKKKSWTGEKIHHDHINFVERSPYVNNKRDFYPFVRTDDRPVSTGFIEFSMSEIEDPSRALNVDCLEGDVWVRQGRTYGYREQEWPLSRSLLLETSSGHKEFRITIDQASTDTIKAIELDVKEGMLTFVGIGGKSEVVKMGKEKKIILSVNNPRPTGVYIPVIVRKENVQELVSALAYPDSHVRLEVLNVLKDCHTFLIESQLDPIIDLLKDKDKLVKGLAKNVLKHVASKGSSQTIQAKAKVALAKTSQEIQIPRDDIGEER